MLQIQVDKEMAEVPGQNIVSVMLPGKNTVEFLLRQRDSLKVKSTEDKISQGEREVANIKYANDAGIKLPVVRQAFRKIDKTARRGAAGKKSLPDTGDHGYSRYAEDLSNHQTSMGFPLPPQDLIEGDVRGDGEDKEMNTVDGNQGKDIDDIIKDRIKERKAKQLEIQMKTMFTDMKRMQKQIQEAKDREIEAKVVHLQVVNENKVLCKEVKALRGQVEAAKLGKGSQKENWEACKVLENLEYKKMSETKDAELKVLKNNLSWKTTQLEVLKKQYQENPLCRVVSQKNLKIEFLEKENADLTLKLGILTKKEEEVLPIPSLISEKKSPLLTILPCSSSQSGSSQYGSSSQSGSSSPGSPMERVRPSLRLVDINKLLK